MPNLKAYQNESCQATVPQVQLNEIAEEIMDLSSCILSNSYCISDRLFGPSLCSTEPCEKEQQPDNLELRLRKVMNILSQANETLSNTLSRI